MGSSPGRTATFDFLPPGGGEDHGYDAFIATVDALVIGRKTYETVLGFKEWFYRRSRCLCSAPGPSPRPRGRPGGAYLGASEPILLLSSTPVASNISM